MFEADRSVLFISHKNSNHYLNFQCNPLSAHIPNLHSFILAERYGEEVYLKTICLVYFKTQSQ